jgi:tripartite-type tricarboxylate transporter receptor subunit TctC
MTRFPTVALNAAVLAGGAGAALLGRSPGHAQSPAWQPTQAVNYLISVAPGGSVDLYARGIKNALESLQLVNGQTMCCRQQAGGCRPHGLAGDATQPRATRTTWERFTPARLPARSPAS